MDFPLPAPDLTIPTVTPNPTIGRTFFIDEILLGRRIPVRNRLVTASGKAVNASLVLAGWGAHSAALGFAAGATGHQHAEMLAAQGVEPDFIWTEGETRTNIIMVTADARVTTLADDTLIVAPAAVDALVARFVARLEGADAATLGGPLPATVPTDLYLRLLAAAHRGGTPVVLDAFADGVEQWVRAGPAWIKPNRFELEMLTGHPITTLEQALAGAATLHAETGAGILVSLDAEGGVAAFEGALWRIPPLAIKVVSAEGAGDAMVAGLAVAVARRLPAADVVRLSMAAGAAATMQPGVGVAALDDMARLWAAVQILPA